MMEEISTTTVTNWTRGKIWETADRWDQGSFLPCVYRSILHRRLALWASFDVGTVRRTIETYGGGRRGAP